MHVKKYKREMNTKMDMEKAENGETLKGHI